MGLSCLDIMVPISTILNDEAVNELDGADMRGRWNHLWREYLPIFIPIDTT
jgi:hypothetical protein